MTTLEIAWGQVAAGRRRRARLARSDQAPIDALEQAVLPALERPPCLVHFSGGVDSSLVLAAALRAARRHRLDPPVAYTRRYPSSAAADESEWQELVISHFGPVEWERRVVDDEDDLVGPTATASLRRYGVVWPPLVHAHGPDLERAASGSVVTGEGGDEVFGARRLAPLRALARRHVPFDRYGMARAGLAVAPKAVRRAAARRQLRAQVPTPWLRPTARLAFEENAAAEAAAEPVDWRRALQEHPRRRPVRLGMATMRAVAQDAGVLRVDPLLDDAFLASFSSAGGRFGPLTRSDALGRFFSDVLPELLITRRTKARFNEAVWNEHTRAFVRRWDGSGVDPDLVDVDALRAMWSVPGSNAMSFALLQSCWLATEGGQVPSTGAGPAT